MMKRIALIGCLMCCCVWSLPAQTEVVPDSLPDWNNARFKSFDGFLLDMGPMMEAPSLRPLTLPSLSSMNWEDSLPLYRVNPDAVAFRPGVVYGGSTTLYPSSFSIYSMLNSGFSTSNVELQGATFKLKNGMSLTTYGEYDADGYKRPNPSALPWQRNNFNAAFEMKSANGKFGIRLEVQSGRNYP